MNQITGIKAKEEQTTMKRTSKRAAIVSMAAGAAAVSILSARVNAATVTWTGAVADPNSATYSATAQGMAAGFTTGQNLYLWNTSAANWSGAPTFTAGDNVIFTDNFAGGSDIRLTNGTLNPASMTFSHIAGSTPVLYRFTHNGGRFAEFVGKTSTNPSANSP